jgi:hypothetical protein
MPRVHSIVSRVATAVALLLAGLAALAWAGQARGDVPLYEVTVPLRGTTEADRTAGFAAALRAVAVKVSGRREAADSATVAQADPARYVQRYSMADGPALRVGFDARATERLLQEAGLPLWPAERPLTTVDAPGADRAAIEAAAGLRGLPIAWSAGVGGGATALLRGEPSGGGFSWSFTHAGTSVSGSGSAADGVHLAADTLAARYAPPSTRGTARLSLRIGGMTGVREYAGLLEYLGSLSLVRDVEVGALEGEVVTLRVEVRGDRELLARIAALDGRLQPGAPAVDGQPAAVDFVYQP